MVKSFYSVNEYKQNSKCLSNEDIKCLVVISNENYKSFHLSLLNIKIMYNKVEMFLLFYIESNNFRKRLRNIE